MDTHNQQPPAAFRSHDAPAPGGADALANLLGQMLGLNLAVLAEVGEAEMAKSKGMRRLDLKALMCIAQLEPLPTGRLVQILGMSPGGVASILNRLEDAGLVRRDRNLQDRRQISLYLASERALDRIFPDYAANALRPVLDSKNPRDVENLLELLAECLEVMTKLAEGRPEYVKPIPSPSVKLNGPWRR